MFRPGRTITAALAALALVIGSVILTAAPAYAADSVSVSPSSKTVTSNTLTTYTLTYSCSTTGNCLNTTVTIPTDNVTGNGANTDFSSWVAAGTCPALTKTAGLVTFTLGTVLTGTYSCNFTVRAPNKTTLNGAQATITPTFNSSGGSVTAPASAVLTLTAGHNVGMGAGVNPTNVLSGATMTLSSSIACGSSQSAPNGDLGLSALHFTDTLPANFTFTGITTVPASLPGTFTLPAVGSSGGTITYDGDGSECLNPANNRIIFTVQGTASQNGVPDAVGAQICHTASSTFTYVDGVSSSAASVPASPCATVIDLDWRTGKSVTPKTMVNRGQYKALDNSVPPLYTFPGNWDGGATTSYDITVNTNPSTTNSGLSYDIKDPLPCIDNLSGAKYLSNTPGVACANPAYIPRVITVTGFAPAAGATIDLLLADGTTTTVPYVAGTGWTLPTSPAVSEIDIPPFTQMGNNNFGAMTFHVTGYASPASVPGHILSNTTTVNAYLSGTSTLVKTAQSPTANILVADPAANGTGANVAASMSTADSGGCVARVQLQGSLIEITQGPSRAIYLDYLGPAGVSSITVPALTFTMTGSNGTTYTASGLTVANQVVNYNGTGRTLIEWTVPAGLAVVPGLYTLGLGGFDVNLGAGCAGTFSNAMTIGYGAAIPTCAVGGTNQAPPSLPPGDTALTTNGSLISGNYCGASAPLAVTAVNPGFSVDKLVQGNLDATQIGAGGTGHVSTDGGAATYTVSFTNTGQSTLANPIMYDLLPRLGDTRASATTPRNSQFPVALTGVGALPANLTVSYSQATNPCRPEVLSPNVGCVDDWSATPPSPLSDITALRFSYVGDVLVSAGFTATYTVSTPPTTAGNIAWNSIGTNVISDDTLLGAAESSLTGLQAQSAQPAITKVADVTSVSAVGDQIVFTFTVTNNTAVALTNVSVADALVNSAPSSAAPIATCTSLASPAGACSGATTALAPGQSAVFTATYTTTQADLDHGSISDQGKATATPPSGPALVNSSDVVTVTAEQSAALSLVKEATPTTVDEEGDTVDYTFTVENTGNVTVTDVGIDETDFSGTGAPLSVDCPTAPLAPGDQVECTATYAVTQGDVDAGSITNTATATGTTPAGAVTSGLSSATVLVDQAPSLDFTKTATPEEVSSAGQTITYSFLVTNDGNVTISGIAIDETVFSGAGTLSAIDCPVTTLAPDDDVTCTATYLVQQADLDAGSISNSAVATGNDPVGTPIPAPPTSDFTVAVLSLPAISLDKTADLAASEAGATITYTFVVTNEGNVALSGVGVTDPMSGLSAIAFDWAGDPGDLGAGEAVTGTATYAVTQSDLDAGTLDNSATASGTPATGDPVADTDDATVAFVQDPQLSMVKTGELSDPDGIDVGSELTFRFEITNAGNVTVQNVDIDDDLAGLSGITFGAWPDATGVLEPGDTVTASATYELTSDDLDAGSVVNVASATGDAPGGDPSFETSVTVPLDVSPAVTIDKVGTLDTSAPPVEGDTITFDFTVENTGNVPLTGVAIDDELDGLGAIDYTWPGATDGRIGSGETMTATATYTLTQDDIDAGSVVNTATVNGDAPGNDTATATDVEQVDLPADPGITLTKTSDFDSDKPMAGDEVPFDFTVENTGNVTVTGVDIADGMAGLSGITFGAWPGADGELAPGDSVPATATYELTQDDIDAGELENEATASGDAARGGAVSDDADVTVPLAQVPGLELVKTADRDDARLDDVIEFTIEGTNTGNTTLSDLLVEDGMPGLSALDFEWPGDEGVLAPGEAVTVTATYTVGSGDVQSGKVVNTATATALTLGQSTTSATADASVVVTPPDIPLALTGARGTLLIGGIGLSLLGGGLAVLLALRIRRRTA